MTARRDDASTPGPGPSDPLNAALVWLAYRGILRRVPSRAEVEHQVATLSTVGDLLAVIEASEEYAALAPPVVQSAAARTTINWWHPDAAPFTHTVGQRSPDGVSIIGHDGWVFLAGGSNSVLGQFNGEHEPAAGWLESWLALLEERRAQGEREGRRVAFVVVPDKLAVQREAFPLQLASGVERPVERLIDADRSRGLLRYPLAELRAAAVDGPVYLRTDSHLTFRGNHALYGATVAALGVEPLPMDAFTLTDARAASGDLGARFDPPVVEVMRTAGTLGAATIAEDNFAAVIRAGGHIGTRRIFRNPQAADSRTVVLFGDSYGIGSEAYQGLSWFLAQSFAEVHFVWTPFGWDSGYLDRCSADLVVCETAERFVVRVPARELDVDGLIAETLGRESAIDPGAIFTDGS